MTTERYAEVSWGIEDIHNHREEMGYPAWTATEAEDFLADNESILEQVMIQRGWEALHDLMPSEEEVDA